MLHMNSRVQLEVGPVALQLTTYADELDVANLLNLLVLWDELFGGVWARFTEMRTSPVINNECEYLLLLTR